MCWPVLARRFSRRWRRNVIAALSVVLFALLPALFGVAQAPAPSVAQAGDESLPMLGAELDQAQILGVLQAAAVSNLQSVGHTSVVLRAKLHAPIDAAFKPQTFERPRGYAAEVAAYRLARLVALDNVPPGTVRRFQRDQFKAQLRGDDSPVGSRLVEGMRFDPQGWVQGAMVYWIPTMQTLPLEKKPLWDQWHAWLRQGESIPQEQRSLAGDLATMIAWDYWIANWDRFSGGNVLWLPSAGRLFLRDHDLAFAHPLPARLHDRLRGHLESVQRFSRRFVRQLIRLQRVELTAALRADGAIGRDALLTAAQVDDLWDRRAALLSYVGALVDSFGVEQVLCFP